MPEGAVSVTRPGRWGNPFQVGHCYKRGDPDDSYRGPLRMVWSECLTNDPGPGYVYLNLAQVIEWYRWYLELTKPDLSELRGKDLACWCPVEFPCHADVLLELANRSEGGDR